MVVSLGEGWFLGIPQVQGRKGEKLERGDGAASCRVCN